jgi:Mce-associated membrane protein
MAEHADAATGTLSETANGADATADVSPAEPDADAVDYDDAIETDADGAEASEGAASARRFMSTVRLATVVGLVTLVSLTGLSGWLGWRGYQAQQAAQQRELLVQIARQGALNLTTIDWQHADNDVRRILDTATGPFYDDFSSRSQPFIEVVKKAQSKSVGTVTAAGLESQSGDEAQVMVALSVKSSNLGDAEQEPRNWRMRISVQRLGDQVKVSNVAFVP